MHLRLLSFLFNDICLTFIINGFSGTIKSTNIWLPSNWQNQQQQIKFASKRTLKCPRHKNPSNSKLPHSNQYSFLSIQCRINYINFCTLESHLLNKPKSFAFLSIAFITKMCVECVIENVAVHICSATNNSIQHNRNECTHIY